MDDVLDKELYKNGFVVGSFLNQNETKQLVNFFYKNHPARIDGFYASAHAQDIPFRNKMNDEMIWLFNTPFGLTSQRHRDPYVYVAIWDLRHPRVLFNFHK